MTAPFKNTTAERRRYPQTRAAVREARLAVVDFAQRCGFGGQCLDDIENAVGEALANAVEHGYVELGNFEVDIRCDNHRVIIEVIDSGQGFDVDAAGGDARPAGDALRGFGRFIMRELMDEVEYSERGTCLRLTKRLPTVASAERSLRTSERRDSQLA